MSACLQRRLRENIRTLTVRSVAAQIEPICEKFYRPVAGSVHGYSDQSRPTHSAEYISNFRWVKKNDIWEEKKLQIEFPNCIDDGDGVHVAIQWMLDGFINLHVRARDIDFKYIAGSLFPSQFFVMASLFIVALKRRWIFELKV